MSAHAEFRPGEPLPEATMLLEASAGTGKTHSITSIVLRLVAEHDIPIEQLLVVTFTRAAAAELRGRIRDRIARAVDALEDWPAAPVGDDEVIALLAGGDVPEEQVRARLDRLRAARSHVDDATIDTIHGFCARTIQQAGPLVGVEPGAELHEDLSSLVGEVVNDLLARAARDRVLGVHRRLEGDLRPDTLVGLVARLEARPDVRVVGADPQADLAGEWTALVDRFAARWAAQRNAFADWVVATRDAGGFRSRQRTYTADRLATHAAAIDEWLAGERYLGGLGEVEGSLDWLGRRAIEGYLASGEVPDRLDVVDLAEEVRLAHARQSDRVRARLVRDAVEEVARRKHDAGVLSFSDLLSAIANALEDPAVAGAVRSAIRARYRVALIDEFQDTDPIQWRIFSQVFDDTRLVLVGDPKQAIYAFRGADVRTYLRAADAVDPEARRTLRTNYRSDARLLAALERLFGRDAAFEPDGVFAEPGIDFVGVRAPEGTAGRWSDPQGPGARLRVRFVGRDEPDGTATIPKYRATSALLASLVEEVSGLLDSGVTIGAGDDARPLKAGDLAVLVRTRRQAALVQERLLDAGIAAVRADDTSVLDTRAALALERLLSAVLHPSDERGVRVTLAGPVFMLGADEIEALEDGAQLPQVGTLDEARGRWHRDGVYPMLRWLLATTGAQARIVREHRGERLLTDLLHVAELLHRAEVDQRLGPERLVGWLADQRRAGVRREVGPDEHQLRLESDADAVQVVTVHRAKGLQYPVVWCPFLSEGRGAGGADQDAWFHDPDDGSRQVDLGGKGDPDRRRRVGLARLESWREEIRLLYVALTRAQHLAIVHTGAISGLGLSPLARVLYGVQVDARDDGTLVAEPDPATFPDEMLLERLEALADDDLVVEQLGAPDTAAGPTRGPHALATATGRVAGAGALEARSLTRTLDRTWQRTSFSRLVRGRQPIEGDDDGRDVDDVAEVDDLDGAPVGRVADGAEVPLAAMPRGPAVGTFVHAVLEELDFPQAVVPGYVRGVVDRHLRRSGVTGIDVDALVDALGGVVTTPLGRCVGDTRLVDVARSDRRDELRFDLPVAGGDRHLGAPLTLTRIAQVLERHAADDVTAAAAARLRDRGAPARGFLTGSIDLLARVDGRWLVVDHKSNWLGGTDGDGVSRSTIGDYHPGRLGQVMVHHDYVLQAHLYLLAVHRLLRWRLGPTYDYDRDVAGFAYLFVRGMVGADTPVTADGEVHGVYASRPSRELVEDLDAAVAGGQRR